MSIRAKYSSYMSSLADRKQMILSLLPRVGDAVWIGLFAFVWQIGQKIMNADGDLGRHLAIGSYILDIRKIPTEDLFSHTMLGQHLIPHEWLSEVIFAAFYRWWGFSGVVFLSALIIATTFWAVYRNSLKASRSLVVSAFVSILVIFASLLHWLSRPHLFTFLLMALWVYELESMRLNSGERIYRRWWIFPLSMVLWVNLHGAFIAGFVTWGLYCAGLALDSVFNQIGFVQGWRSQKSVWLSFLLVGGTSALAALLNPSGVQLWDNSFGYLGNKFLVDITVEYRSPDFHNLSTQPFLGMIGLFVVLLGMRFRKISGPQLIAAGAWLVMGLYSARNIPLFAIVSAPVLAGLIGGGFEFVSSRWKRFERFWTLDQGLQRLETSTYIFLYPLLAVLIVLSSLMNGGTIGRSSSYTFNPKDFPVEAVDWLEEHPQAGNVFNEFTWGGYLLYRLWPEQRVFIDGQTDFYGEALTKEYLQVKDFRDDWEQVLDQYNVTWIIIPTQDRLAAELHRHPAWESIYQDDTAVIFVETR